MVKMGDDKDNVTTGGSTPPEGAQTPPVDSGLSQGAEGPNDAETGAERPIEGDPVVDVSQYPDRPDIIRSPEETARAEGRKYVPPAEDELPEIADTPDE